MSKTATPHGGVTKRILVGRAVSSGKLEHTLLPKVLALPVFSSDALSSVAYASEEILRVLLIASIGTAYLVGPIALAISLLLAIVVLSYRQTVKAYPSGGGAYIVSRENLGQTPGLIAASALLVDYMMTVVVSTVAGVVAIISAIPSLSPYRVEMSVFFVILVTLANLRGVKEAGTLFAIPTYGFILCIVTLIGVGLLECSHGCPVSVLPPDIHPGGRPRDRRRRRRDLHDPEGVLVRRDRADRRRGDLERGPGLPPAPGQERLDHARDDGRSISIAMFLGISFLTTHIDGITISAERSVVAQIGSAVFGEGSFAFYVVQAFTAAILILAANTAYQDFPRLASILARDRYMPRQFMNRGDRLVFSNGVIGLALGSILVIVAFDANLNKLIQMYVVGVFTSFTLSQTGMIRHWLAERHKGAEAQKGWQTSIVINTIGAITTGVVLVVVTATKFKGGAWLSILVMAMIVPLLLSIHRHYLSVSAQLRRGEHRIGEPTTNHIVLLVRDLDAATAEALGYIRSFRPSHLICLYPGGAGDLPERWRVFAGDAPDLVTLPDGGGDLFHRVRDFVRSIDRAPDDFVTVVVPEVVRESLFTYVVRKRELIRLKGRLLREPNVVVTDVPVVITDRGPQGVDAKPLIPNRTVTLVFVAKPGPRPQKKKPRPRAASVRSGRPGSPSGADSWTETAPSVCTSRSACPSSMAALRPIRSNAITP